MTNPLLQFHHIYLVGIKGVAMTSLAQCLIDAGIEVRGSDVAESFVTQPILDQLQIPLDADFSAPLPPETDCVIYTAAHQAQQNPQVLAAVAQQLPVYSHAEALSFLFNDKQGVAVCGVGGKSTTSAMITWILSHSNPEQSPSFAIGVGNIPGLNKTGAWSAASSVFVAEADEYVTDPTAPSRGETITPRFSYLHPFITVCTTIAFDHPDVYRDEQHTQAVFATFFHQIKPGGTLVANAKQRSLIESFRKQGQLVAPVLFFGEENGADLQLTTYASHDGETRSLLATPTGETVELTLQIPGKFNVMNAAAALLAVQTLGVSLANAAQALASFHSTMRRSEFIGENNGVRFYDDYAHHPNEVANIIHAFKEWYPKRRLVVAFQSHTFSRTKALFTDFVTAFAEADEVAMIDIFASARESADPSISSDLLCEAIVKAFPGKPAQNHHDLSQLAHHLHATLHAGDVCLTVGAGDIYRVHQLLKK